MKTNDIFNFRRFGKYFVSDMKTCMANYGLSLITISTLMLTALYLVGGTYNLMVNHEWNGPDTGYRFFIFCVMMLCLIVTMPVKCYGKITEKQYGSFWLTLPASRLEKFLSMTILCSIVVPGIGIILYLGLNSIICAIDNTCGSSLVGFASEMMKNVNVFFEEYGHLSLNFGTEQVPVENSAIAAEILKPLTSPWLYIDDLLGMILPFMLGAIYFKNGKTVKTFLVIFAVGTVTSIIATPVMMKFMAENLGNIFNNDVVTENVLRGFIDKGIMKKLVILDTVSDTLINIALLTGIWFRIKTLKH